MTGNDEDFFRERTLARSKALRRIGVMHDAAAPPADATPEEPRAPPRANGAARATLPPPATPPSAMPPPSPMASASAPAAARPHMVDVGAKPVVHREATAEGFLRLQAATLDALRHGTAPKGDPFPTAQVAGILAAKATPQLIPLCHPLPLTGIEVDLFREAGGVRCRATVRTDGKTGVEMEALAAVTAALLTVWDMTKALEKDERGQYPGTAIEGVRVVSKTKGGAA